jgi:hypothetical protein
MSKGRKDKDMICGLTADEHEVLQRELKALPETMPPRAVWNRIREQAEAEGLVGQQAMRRPLSWQGGMGLAAAAALVAVLVPTMYGKLSTDLPTEPTSVATTNNARADTLQALMVESRQLEGDLRALPAQPRVQRLGTAATISDIEDRIAAIDYQLNDPDVEMTPDEEEIFWRERVRLMKLLVRLRYAQAQRTAY